MDIALALGGGGVRGIAHIGVISGLEQAGYRIKAIAGTSVGGIIGAIYASGYSPTEIELMLSQLNQKKLFGRKPGDGPSLMGLTGLTNLLLEKIGARNYSDLKIPLAVTAVDMNRCQEVVLLHGQVVQTILATIAVPGIFPPIQIADTLLTDGAGLNPVPVSVAHWLAPELPVVAVVLDQYVDPNKNAGFPFSIPGPASLVETFTRLRIAQALSIFIQSTEITSARLTELRLQVDPPDVIIRPDVGHIGLLDQVNVSEVIRLGEQACVEQLENLKNAVSISSRVNRRLRKLVKANPILADTRIV